MHDHRGIVNSGYNSELIKTHQFWLGEDEVVHWIASVRCPIKKCCTTFIFASHLFLLALSFFCYGSFVLSLFSWGELLDNILRLPIAPATTGTQPAHHSVACASVIELRKLPQKRELQIWDVLKVTLLWSFAWAKPPPAAPQHCAFFSTAPLGPTRSETGADALGTWPQGESTLTHFS